MNLPLFPISLLLALAFSGCATAKNPEGPADSASKVLASVIKRDGGPGVMAAIVKEGEVIWSGAAGMADVENGVHLTTATKMRIGSVSKPLTAALLLRLYDRGLIDPHADIRKWVLEFASDHKAPVSSLMLAAHTSGIRQYDFANYLDANNVFYHSTLTEAFAKVAGDALIHAPGEAFHYSSLGYNVLGIVAERVSESGFADVMAREVTQPLGLHNTMIDHPLEIIPNRTRFYTRYPDGVVRNTIWRDSSDYYPSGGMLSTAEDLARFASAVFDSAWLSDEAKALLTTELTTRSGEPVGYTFGWQIVRHDDGTVAHFEHGGETNGAYAFLRYYLAERIALSGIANANFAVGKPYFFTAISQDLPAVFGIATR